MKEELTAIQKAHAWQSHRMECLKLAIEAGATHENVCQVAQNLSEYIMTPSEREKGVTE